MTDASKGLAPIELQVYDRTGLRLVRTGVLLRSGEFAQAGILVNFCPFCGEPIAGQLAAEAGAK